jgi:hypothetical protein
VASTLASSLSSDPESDPDDSAFLAAFLAGFSSEESDPESDPDDSAFLAAAFLATGLADSSESESEEDSTLAFFCGTTAFSAVFFALLEFLLAAETFEAALDLFWAGLASDESESESEEDSTFFLDFLTSLTGAATFFSASFFDLFLSTLTFLAGASDDELSESELLEATTFFVF